MKQANETSTNETNTAVLEAPAPAAKPQQKKGRHVLASAQVYVEGGNTYIDLSSFGLPANVRIGGGGSFVPPTALKSLQPKVDRASKTDDVNYDVDDATVNVELVGNTAYAIANLLAAAPKSHAKPVGCKGNTRKHRIVAIRESNRGKGVRIA